MTYLLALDQGTSSSRSIVFDRQGRIVALAQKELPQIYNRWFMKRLPNGERFNIALSPQLEEMWQAIGLPE